MDKYTALHETQKRKLLKAIEHLEYSYKKIQSLSDNVEQLDDESLETWESFAARFSRVSEMFLGKYLRTIILMNDPGYDGRTVRDYLNQGEKLGLINNTDTWMAIRELRNISVHDYSEEDISAFFNRLKYECPHLLAIKNLLLAGKKI